jgi:hypothetical protein
MWFNKPRMGTRNYSVRAVKIAVLAAVVAAGLTARGYLATGRFNPDLQSFIVNADLFRQRVPNFYTVQPVYGYPPLWYYVCGLLGELQRAIGIVSFPFVERMFLGFVDLAIMAVLMVLARHRRRNPLVVGTVFFLNPISIIITGYHGQFDNLTLLFVVTAILVLETGRLKRMARELGAFFLLTLALLFKQAILFHAMTVFMAFDRKRYVGVVLTGLAVILFALSYVPFLPGAWGPTRNTMNQYGGILGVYGFSYLAAVACGRCELNVFGMYFWVFLRNIFMGMMGLYILFTRNRDVARTCLLMTLFFYTFTTGIAPQYFVYPLVFGALFPSKWFVLYSIITGMFLAGHWDELGIPAFQTISYNVVWLTIVIWYASELVRTNPTANKWYVRLKAAFA